MEDLLNKFGDLLSEYSRHREYIRRAQAQGTKFSSAVIEKVVLDHEVKSSSVADQLLPLVPEIEAHIAGIDEEVATINADKASADEQYQELELRKMIGELEDDEFEVESGDLKAKLQEADGRLSELGEDRDAHSEALNRWIELAAEASQDDGTSAGAGGDEAPADEPEEEEEEALPDEPVVVDEADGSHATQTSIKEDVSAVFEDGDGEEAAQVEVDDGGVAIEAGDADVDFGFEEDEADAGEEVELDLVGGGGASDAGADEIGIDLDVAEESAEEEEEEAAEEAAADGESDEGGDEDDARRALLLYQEGTADEQIYPFTGEVLTIGRGRDNDIQIKNDSKVSRFHCKLFRRGGNFYVEDNKSSNGTLVNGELITERRLFGGEEVIIGETFFRFRIM